MRISGNLRDLGSLGSSADIYSQVTNQGGSSSQAEAAARSGSTATYNQSVQPTQPDWFRNLYYAPKPSIALSSDGIAPYFNLSDKPLTFAGVTWLTPILNPHRTTALNWVEPNVINKGAPSSLYDPVEYLRSALIDSDWDRVFYWFAMNYAQLYSQVGNSRDAFWPFASINILSYKYVVNDAGQRVYYPFSQYDLWQFISRIVANFSITDLGAHGKCAIGLLNWGDPNKVVPYDVDGELTGPNQWWNAFNQGLFGYGHTSSVFQYTSVQQLITDSQNPHTSSSPIGDLRVGWIQAPSGPWTFEKVLSLVVILVVSYYAGAALGALYASVFGTTTATAGLSAGAATVGSSTGAATTATVGSSAAGAAAGALDEIVITGSIASGISVGSALTAGSVIAAATAPAIAGATAPSIQVNAPNSAPALDEVVVTGTASTSTVSAASVGAAITAGAVAVATAPAVLTTPDIVTTQPTTNNATSPDTLDEVVVTGTATTSVSSVGTALAVGSVIATAAPAIADATTISDPNTTTQPDQTTNSSDKPSKGTTLEDWLKSLVKKYGLAWVKAHLASLLKQFYGVDPSQAQLDAADASLGSGINWWLIGAAALAAIAGSS